MNRIKSHFIDNHLSYVYENVCREKMWDFDGKLFFFDRCGRWWNKHEIDIVVYDSSGTDMIFGECKYSIYPKEMDVLLDLMEKSKEVKWKNNERKEYYVLFSRSGYSDALRKYAAEHDRIYLLQ